LPAHPGPPTHHLPPCLMRTRARAHVWCQRTAPDATPIKRIAAPPFGAAAAQGPTSPSPCTVPCGSGRPPLSPPPAASASATKRAPSKQQGARGLSRPHAGGAAPPHPHPATSEGHGGPFVPAGGAGPPSKQQGARGLSRLHAGGAAPPHPHPPSNQRGARVGPSAPAGGASSFFVPAGPAAAAALAWPSPSCARPNLSNLRDSARFRCACAPGPQRRVLAPPRTAPRAAPILGHPLE
jgi:hypothetical protein